MSTVQPWRGDTRHPGQPNGRIRSGDQKEKGPQQDAEASKLWVRRCLEKEDPAPLAIGTKRVINSHDNKPDHSVHDPEDFYKNKPHL